MVPIWTPLAVALAGALAREAPEAHQDSLRVSAPIQRYEVSTGLAVYEGGVRAEGEGLVLTASRLTVQDTPEATRAEASGDVVVDDGEALLQADRFVWDWRRRTGRGERVRLTVGKSVLQADSVEVDGGVWTLCRVVVTPCAQGRAPYSFRSEKVVVERGRRAKLQRAEFAVFGSRIVGLPSYRLALSPGEAELRMPRFGLTEEGVASATWDQAFPLSRSSGLSLGTSLEDGRRPGYEARLGWSGLGELPPRPYGDLGNRFPYGFFDQLTVSSPEQERSLMGTRRAATYLATQWSVRPSGRAGDPDLNKPIEAIAEVGGPMGPWAGWIQLRGQRIERVDGPGVSRIALQGSLAAPRVSLGGRASWVNRFDVGGYAGGREMAWAQAQTGLIYSPTKGLDLGVAWVEGGQVGHEDFAFDRLYSSSALHLRLDWHGGPTKLALLGKYDWDRRSWYDYGFQLRQVAGCVEPFVSWRKFPDDFTIGVNLRLDDLTDWIRRRSRGAKPVKPR